MNILGLDITSVSLVEVLKILIKILDLLATGGNNEFQEGSIYHHQQQAFINFGNNTAVKESVEKFSNDLYDKTINFLKNNFKEEDLMQISDKINWKKQEPLKEEPPKQSHARAFR